LAAGSSEGAADPSLRASWAHRSITLPVAGSFTSIERRCAGSEQSSASVKKATTTLAPSRKKPGCCSASSIACIPCGWRAPAMPTFTLAAR
jgi:hypothetical protein